MTGKKMLEVPLVFWSKLNLAFPDFIAPFVRSICENL